MTNRAAVYIRMSTDEQVDSPQRQREQILPYCEVKGYRIVKTYQDLAERGWDDTRPDFQKLLTDAQNRLFDFIVVDESSRLSRQLPLEFIAKVVYPLQQAGVRVDSVSEGLVNWDELPGMIMLTVRQDKASQESVTLGRRTATGMVKRAKEGKLFVGRPSYGYKYRTNNDGHRTGLEPDDEHSEKRQVVERIFDAYVNRDLSLMAIVSELNSLGILSPQGCERWGKTTVRNILTNHVYAGSYVWGKVPQGRYFRCDGGEVVPAGRGNKSERTTPDKWMIIPNHHAPLVSPSIFDRAQDLLKANRPRTSPSRKKCSYPLSQLLICSHCNTRMYGTTIQSGGRKIAVYRCGSNMSNGTCAPRIVREPLIINKVTEVLRSKFLDADNLERLRTEVQRQQREQHSNSISVQNQLRRNITNLEVRINKAKKNLILMDAEDIPRAKAQIRGWEDEQFRAKSELDAFAKRSPVVALEDLIKKLERLPELLASADPALTRSLFRETIQRVELCFQTVQKSVVKRYPLVRGVIYLCNSQSVDSSSSCPGAAH